MKRLGLFLALLLCAAQAFAYTYTNNQLGFSVKLPDGFTNISNPFYGKTLLSIANFHTSREHQVLEVILLANVGKPVYQNDKLTNTADCLSLPDADWNGMDLQVARELKMISGDNVTSLTVWIPLKPNAIEFKVIGQTRDTMQLRTDLDTILATAEGPTNWLTPAESGRGPGPYLICVFVGIIGLLFGSIRITPHYGLADSDARIAGFLILLAGLGLPYLERVFSIAGYLHHLGLNYWPVMASLAGLNIAIIIAITLVMVCINGNIYAKDANPLDYVAPKKPTKEEKKIASAPPDKFCPLCRKPVSSLQSSCPYCHADLARWKELAAAKAATPVQ